MHLIVFLNPYIEADFGFDPEFTLALTMALALTLTLTLTTLSATEAAQRKQANDGTLLCACLLVLCRFIC